MFNQSLVQSLVARQPICERNQKTFAYELLFRASNVDHAEVENAESATAQVIVNSFLDIGLDRMVGPSAAFINVTRDFIVADHCRTLPKDRVVFEILEGTKPDSELFAKLDALKTAGYRFALDDFTFDDDAWSLLPYCSYVKVDVRDTDIQKRHHEIAELRRNPVLLLAEKVETNEEFESCQQAGFEYFQGYFFCRPRVFSSNKTPVNRISLCRLLAKLQQPNASIGEIEDVVAQDLSLSYQLLRYINSAALSLPRKIETVGHAVRLVGVEHIRLLASVMMLTNLEEKPRELIATSLVRARMCELMAQRLGDREPSVYFTAGLFSALDAFLDCPMEKALSQLPLSDRLCNALLYREGPIGKVLDCVLSYERGDWENIQPLYSSKVPLRETWLSSLDWSGGMIRGLKAAAA